MTARMSLTHKTVLLAVFLLVIVLTIIIPYSIFGVELGILKVENEYDEDNEPAHRFRALRIATLDANSFHTLSNEEQIEKMLTYYKMMSDVKDKCGMTMDEVYVMAMEVGEEMYENGPIRKQPRARAMQSILNEMPNNFENCTSWVIGR